MFNWKSNILKKIEEEKNNNIQKYRELTEEIYGLKAYVENDLQILKKTCAGFVEAREEYLEITGHGRPKHIDELGIEWFQASGKNDKKEMEFLSQVKSPTKIGARSVTPRVSVEKINTYKNLPTFISSVEFSKILNIDINQFWRRKKQIDQKVRCYRFGTRIYKYQKTDVLNFMKYSHKEDDVLARLKKTKNSTISRHDLINLLCLNSATFYAHLNQIEEIIPPIQVSEKLTIYKKEDVITFLKRGGLNDH